VGKRDAQYSIGGFEMTKEEHIKNLKAIKKVGLCKKYLDSMNEAIKALEQQHSDDCVDRNHVIATISQHHFDKDKDNFDLLVHNLCKEVKALPPVTPTHGTCKDCNHLCDWHNGRSKGLYCGLHTEVDFCFEVEENFYCAYFEKRGDKT
jgi:hypothetical protein